MHLINNALEYRSWMIKEFFGIEDEASVFSYLSPEELESELFRQRPVQFPCIAFIAQRSEVEDLAILQFFYRDQIIEWATAMNLMTGPADPQ